MNTKSESYAQYTMLSVRFENDLSCNSSSDQRVLNMVGKFSLSDGRSLLIRCCFLVMAFGQNGN